MPFALGTPLLGGQGVLLCEGQGASQIEQPVRAAESAYGTIAPVSTIDRARFASPITRAVSAIVSVA